MLSLVTKNLLEQQPGAWAMSLMGVPTHHVFSYELGASSGMTVEKLQEKSGDAFGMLQEDPGGSGARDPLGSLFIARTVFEGASHKVHNRATFASSRSHLCGGALSKGPPSNSTGTLSASAKQTC